MKSLRILAVLVIAAASTAAFASGGGARGGDYPVAAVAASHVAVKNSGFGGVASTTSQAGTKATPAGAVMSAQAKLFAHH